MISSLQYFGIYDVITEICPVQPVLDLLHCDDSFFELRTVDHKIDGIGRIGDLTECLWAKQADHHPLVKSESPAPRVFINLFTFDVFIEVWCATNPNETFGFAL